jgi:hypothetical protein
MPILDAARFERFVASLPERPASFAERGLAVPFTAPLLAGARLRHSTARGAELLLPALGGRGVYVLDWASAQSLCAPTLHDRQLWSRLALLGAPRPSEIRAAARLTATQGFAGRPARAAAVQRSQALGAAREAVRAALLERLAISGEAAPIAPADLATLGTALAGIGLGPVVAGPVAQAMAQIRGVVAGLEEWARLAPGPDQRRAAAILVGAAQLTLAKAEASLATLWPLLARPQALLAAPGALGQLVLLAERPDWLLDGWEAVAAMWTACAADRRGDALAEMLGLLPVLPLEVDRWPGPPADWDSLLRARRLSPPRPAWAGGGLADLAARNEVLRALAA